MTYTKPKVEVVNEKDTSLQNNEQTKQTTKLVMVNKELNFQNNEKQKCAAELAIACAKDAVGQAPRKNDELYSEYLHIKAVKNAQGMVTNYVEKLTDITTIKAASDEIERLAFYDPLTQLPNRRLFLDRLNQALAVSTHSGRRGALLFLDLDHFKTLNDTRGHDIGDLLLQQVSGRLTACLRESDTVARFGGDEFVVLLENLSVHTLEAAAQTKDIATKMRLSLNQPYQLSAHVYHNTPSIGATLFIGHELVAEELLKQADIAMYQSKAEGRNTLRFFDQMMQETIVARVNLENDLRKAIEQQQFQLRYQIQVNHTGQPSGAEVLISWQHPQRGIVSPRHFIPLAEDIGLILPIGQWVLDEVCAQLKTWQQDPLTKDIVLAVNVSAKQLHQVDFVEQVLATLDRHGANPARLKLELTENMLLENINDIIGKMNALNKMGIRFSLDDFGSGYSSLRYLKMLPLDELKIDQSFVRDIATDSSNRTIVRIIITMAANLGINVIAEGVETAEQRQFLLDNGCFYYQGYLFSKPLPIEKFEPILKRFKLSSESKES
ncbi:MAG: diguanylate cyclase (GGDEF)-like protein [Psychromonas sp.]|jgi:diguanylate cyclase (GGDEF)-like protein|uniref:putative bifunctional diguanylate cyclase/phosphodiesterase n=1 Tax=Psychromonas sp. TaxID=1884585 RepID=UPI0039E55911